MAVHFSGFLQHSSRQLKVLNSWCKPPQRPNSAQGLQPNARGLLESSSQRRRSCRARRLGLDLRSSLPGMFLHSQNDTSAVWLMGLMTVIVPSSDAATATDAIRIIGGRFLQSRRRLQGHAGLRICLRSRGSSPARLRTTSGIVLDFAACRAIDAGNVSIVQRWRAQGNGAPVKGAAVGFLHAVQEIDGADQTVSMIGRYFLALTGWTTSTTRLLAARLLRRLFQAVGPIFFPVSVGRIRREAAWRLRRPSASPIPGSRSTSAPRSRGVSCH